MPILANASVSQLYTLPADAWKVINQRVGIALALEQYQSFVGHYIPGYGGLLTSSKLWRDHTFGALVSQSKDLAKYAQSAADRFADLNQAIKEANLTDPATAPAAIKTQTTRLLQQLAADTGPLASDCTRLAQEVLTFFDNVQTVDAQVASHRDQLGQYWTPVGDNINAAEKAAGSVTGEWRAITDDLNDAAGSTVNVTVPFLESLGLDAAVASWQNVYSEAAAFPALADGQQQYWAHPF